MVSAKMLQKYSLFGGLLEEQLEKIIPLMELKHYASGDVVILEGTPNDTIFFMIEGRVSIIKGDTVIYDLAEGNTFGEMEILDVMPSAATVKAVTDITVISISNKSFHEIYKNDIQSFALLLMNLARDVSRRLRVANEIMAGGKKVEVYSAALFTNH